MTKLYFAGVLAYVDESSDKPPAGARGHRIILDRVAAVSALDSLIGAHISCTMRLDSHGSGRVGIITGARMEGNEIHIQGELFASDFPEVVRAICEDERRLGLSFELADARIEDCGEEVWRLTRITFTGAAILLKTKAAYYQTSIRLIQSPLPWNHPASKPN